MSYGREITVEQTVVVEIDDTKFTPEWMEEFRASFFRFYDLDDHLRHLGQLYVRGLIDGRDDEFIEGYGVASEMVSASQKSGVVSTYSMAQGREWTITDLVFDGETYGLTGYD